MQHSWRGRIGLVILSPNTTIEYEFARMMPEGVWFHTARCFLPDVSDKDEKVKLLNDLDAKVVEAAQRVATARPDVILFACTIGSFLKGIGHDRDLSDRITEATSIPAITTTTAVLEALEHMNCRGLTLVSPYHPEAGRAEQEFLERQLSPLKVLGHKHLDIIGVMEKGMLPPWSAYQAVCDVLHPETDGIFISCTNWRSMEIVPLLERDTGLPVITSVQASLWACLKRIGVMGGEEFGRIFSW